MRLFIFIFSLYIFALSIMPCDTVYHDCNIDSPLTESPQDHSHGSDHNDICNPFCTCAGFSIFVSTYLTPQYFSNAKVVDDVLLKFVNWEFSFASKFFGKIWQPPKIF
jgi:predicted small integral membrane protein